MRFKKNEIKKKVLVYTLATGMAFSGMSSLSFNVAYAASLEAKEITTNETLNDGNMKIEKDVTYTLKGDDAKISFGTTGLTIVKDKTFTVTNGTKSVSFKAIADSATLKNGSIEVKDGEIVVSNVEMANVEVKGGLLDVSSISNITVDSSKFAKQFAISGNVTLSNVAINNLKVNKENDDAVTVNSGANLTLDNTTIMGTFSGATEKPVAENDIFVNVNAKDVKLTIKNNTVVGDFKMGNGAQVSSFTVFDSFNGKFGIEDANDAKLTANSDLSYANALLNALKKGNIYGIVSKDNEGKRDLYRDGNVLKFGKLEYKMSATDDGFKVVCKNEGSKYQGKETIIPLKKSVEYLGKDSAEVKTLIDDSKVKADNKIAVDAFKGSSAKVSYDAKNSTLTTTTANNEASFTTKVTKKSINDAKVNSLSAFGYNGEENIDLLKDKLVPGTIYVEVLNNSESSLITEKNNKLNVKVYYYSIDGTVYTLDSNDYYVEGLKATDKVGEYSFAVKGIGNYDGTVSGKWYVADKIVDKTYTYTGEELELKIDGVEKYVVDGKETIYAPKGTNAGIYTVQYKDGDETKTAKVVINKKKIELNQDKLDDKSFVYNGNAVAPVVKDIEDVKGAKFTYSYFEKDNNVEKALSSKPSMPGDYSVVISLDKASEANYVLSGNKFDFTIKKASPKVEAPKTITAYYDGVAHTFGDVLKFDIKDGAYKVFYNDNETKPYFTEVGTYKVSYKVVANGEGTKAENIDPRYEEKSSAEGTFEYVVKEAVSVERTDKVASEVTYTGKEFKIAAKAVYTDKAGKKTDATDVNVAIYAKNVDAKDASFVDVTSTGIKAVGNYYIKYVITSGDYTSKMTDFVDGGLYIRVKAAAKTAISKCTITVNKATYNGKNQTAVVTVKNGKTALKANTDYTVTKVTKKNAGTYKVTVKGAGKYNGSKVVNFVIAKKAASKLTVKKVTKKVKSGKKYVNKTYIYVYDGKTLLKANKDYKLTSKKVTKTVTKKVKSGKKYVNKKVKVTTTTKYVAGMGNYSGSKAYK